MATEKTTEVRIELPVDDLAVIDGYCNGTGKNRTAVIREVLGSWSREKLHVSMIVCRVAGVNPMESDKGRNV